MHLLRYLLLPLLLASIALQSGCSGSQLAPTSPGAGETVYTIPTQPGTPPITFSFNLSQLRPRRGGQLVAGAEAVVSVRCTKPAGWEMWARIRGVEGPRLAAVASPMFDMRGGSDGNTGQRSSNFTVGSCADHDQATAYAITAQDPAIPYIRLEAWAYQNGSRFGWGPGSEPGFGWLLDPGGTPQAPAVVADEQVDWGKQ